MTAFNINSTNVTARKLAQLAALTLAVAVHMLLFTFHVRGGLTFVVVYDLLVVASYVVLRLWRHSYAGKSLFTSYFLSYLFRLGLFFAFFLNGSHLIHYLGWKYLGELLGVVPWAMGCQMLELFGRAAGACY